MSGVTITYTFGNFIDDGLSNDPSSSEYSRDTQIEQLTQNAVGNVAIGFLSGNALTSGQDNILLGEKSGGALTAGAGNILIGYEAGLAFTIENSMLAIGTALGGNMALGVIYTQNPNNYTPLITDLVDNSWTLDASTQILYYKDNSGAFHSYDLSGGGGGGVTSIAGLTGAVYATEAANTFYAGPTSGGDAAPTFRAIGAGDITGYVIGGYNGQSTLFVGLAEVSTTSTDGVFVGTTTGLNNVCRRRNRHECQQSWYRQRRSRI